MEQRIYFHNFGRKISFNSQFANLQHYTVVQQQYEEKQHQTIPLLSSYAAAGAQ